MLEFVLCVHQLFWLCSEGIDPTPDLLQHMYSRVLACNCEMHTNLSLLLTLRVSIKYILKMCLGQTQLTLIVSVSLHTEPLSLSNVLSFEQ